MKTLSIDVRRAEPTDARAISVAHRLSWQHTYGGLIPHKPLNQMLERRGEDWWRKATRGPATLLPPTTPPRPHIGGTAAMEDTTTTSSSHHFPPQCAGHQSHLFFSPPPPHHPTTHPSTEARV